MWRKNIIISFAELKVLEKKEIVADGTQTRLISNLNLNKKFNTFLGGNGNILESFVRFGVDMFFWFFFLSYINWNGIIIIFRKKKKIIGPILAQN